MAEKGKKSPPGARGTASKSRKTKTKTVPKANRGPGSRHAILDLPDEAFAMASIGCSDSEIADVYGIERKNFVYGLKAHPEVARKLHAARSKGTMSVTKALWNRATGKHYRDKHGNLHPPDIAAIKFWLCNRAKEHWRSEAKLQVEHSGAIADSKTGADILVEDLSDEQLVGYLADIGVAVANRRGEVEQAIDQAKKAKVN